MTQIRSDPTFTQINTTSANLANAVFRFATLVEAVIGTEADVFGGGTFFVEGMGECLASWRLRLFLLIMLSLSRDAGTTKALFLRKAYGTMPVLYDSSRQVLLLRCKVSQYQNARWHYSTCIT